MITPKARQPLTEEQLRKLESAVTSFIDSNGITCSETIYQSDEVVLGSYKFIDELCAIVGYHDYSYSEDVEVS